MSYKTWDFAQPSRFDCRPGGDCLPLTVYCSPLTDYRLMYTNFYGFKQKPFELLPDPDFLYQSKKHERALTHLEYGIFDRAGFIVITGEIGTGKTTLIRHMLRSIDQDLPIASLSQTCLNPEEFLKGLCQEFSLPHNGKGKSDLLGLFGEFLVEQYRDGRYVVLILDEAQNLPVETLEEIRMLSNLDAGNESLLQVILVGQPSLRGKLQWEGLRQLSQRVQVNYHLEPLDRDEVGNYIRYRIKRAGGQDLNLFDGESIESIFEHSGGVPRLINAVCHMCLVYGMAEDLNRVDCNLLAKVLEDRSSWDVLPGRASLSCDSNFTTPAVLVDTAKQKQVLSTLEPAFERLLEISEGTRAALEQMATALVHLARQGGCRDLLREELTAEKKSRQALERRLVELEKKIDATALTQQRLIRALNKRNKKPTTAPQWGSKE